MNGYMGNGAPPLLLLATWRCCFQRSCEMLAHCRGSKRSGHHSQSLSKHKGDALIQSNALIFPFFFQGCAGIRSSEKTSLSHSMSQKFGLTENESACFLYIFLLFLLVLFKKKKKKSQSQMCFCRLIKVRVSNKRLALLVFHIYS